MKAEQILFSRMPDSIKVSISAVDKFQLCYKIFRFINFIEFWKFMSGYVFNAVQNMMAHPYNAEFLNILRKSK